MNYPERILIVDDVKLDRSSLRRILESEFPDSDIIEAGNADEIWAKLDKRCDLLFQDISLQPTDEVVDSQGIWLLYDVIETFPSLPVIIVSGHMGEKWKDVFDLQKQHGSPLINVLDKGNYSTTNLVDSVAEANEFRNRQSIQDEEVDYIGKLLSERTEELEHSFELQREKLIAEIDKESEESKLREKVISAEDPLVRCKAEIELLGDCGMNLWKSCVELEYRIVSLSGLDSKGVSFHDKALKIRSKFGLKQFELRQLFDAWKIRNRMAHPPPLKPKLIEAKLLIDSLTILDGVEAH